MQTKNTVKDLKPVFCTAGKNAEPGIKATSDHKFSFLSVWHMGVSNCGRRRDRCEVHRCFQLWQEMRQM